MFYILQTGTFEMTNLVLISTRHLLSNVIIVMTDHALGIQEYSDKMEQFNYLLQTPVSYLAPRN